MESSDSQRLQTIANELLDLLTEQNLTSTGSYRPDNNVKLHMTLLNSKYRQEKSNRDASFQGFSPNTRTSFSITGILKIAGNFYFTENQSFHQICLCDRLSFDSSTQFYKCCCKLEFTTDGIHCSHMNKM